MKLFALITFLFCRVPVASPELQSVRMEFQRVAVQESSIDKIFVLCASGSIQPLLAEAYIAAATLCSAKYKFSPFSKFEVFNKGSAMLDAAIAKDTLSVEARYLRYAIQKKAPSFLGYSSHLKKDRLYIIRRMPNLKREDVNLYSVIQAFLVQYDPEVARITGKS